MTAPAEQLRAAAKVLRCDHEFPWATDRNGMRRRADTCAGCGIQWSHREMVAAALADPLAALLEDASLEYERTLRDHGPDAATYAVYHAMPVALAILGEAP